MHAWYDWLWGQHYSGHLQKEGDTSNRMKRPIKHSSSNAALNF